MNKYFIFIPNLLSLSRIALIYPILNNIFLGNFKISIIFFIIASITDALDGLLARRMKWQTFLGAILDPVADKLLLSGTIFIFWLNQLIPFYVFVILISRDVLILIGASIQMSLIESKTPMPNFLGKMTTSFQIIYIALIFLQELVNINLSLFIIETVILIVTLLSLTVYAHNWINDLKSYYSE